MAHDYKVYKSQRIVPVRFKRSGLGQPVLGKPDIDDRGYYRTAITAGNDHGHTVGVMQGNESEVVLERVRIDNKAALYVTSSDTATMTVKDSGGTSKLATAKRPKIKIKGIKGAAGTNPQTAKCEIRYGSETGPIIGELSVWVFKKVTVKLTPHNVTISDSTPAAGIASSVNITSVINLVKAFWEPCGVDFTVDPIQNENVTFANRGDVAWKPEVNTLLNTNYVANSINAYFVNRIVLSGSNGVLGLGISRPNQVAFSLSNPGIILGDTNVSGSNRAADTHWLANDLAHEIGHFFTLEHVDRKNAGPTSRNDFWAVRMLMHPSNKRSSQGNWRDNAGYGTRYRGGLITLKNLTDASNAANHNTDGEALIARGVINGATGPY